MSFWRKYRVILIALCLLIVVGLGVGFGLRKNVTLRVDGQAHSLTTYALTVGSLLHDQGISLSPSDQLSASPRSWLTNKAEISLVRAIRVQIMVDGEIKNIISAERLPSRLLAQAGIQVKAGDVLLSSGQKIDVEQAFPASVTSISLQLVRSLSFTLAENGQSKVITSTASTLGEALWAAGYTLYASDQLTPAASTPLTAGLAATLTHSRPVTILTQSGQVSIRTAASTVGDALEAAHLSPQGLDYSLPAADQPIPKNGSIRLVRVTEQVLIEETSLPVETKFQPDSNVELDSQAVVQAGATGINAQRIRIRYEDGVEASRKVESDWVARQPQDRIIGYGTSVVMHTTTVDGVTIQYWRSLTMYATSYHPSEVGDTTASGLPLKKGVVAVDTSLIPFFTQLYIPGYGEAIAADRGGGVIGRWIDLGYSDDDYIPWHSWVTVYFLWPPPDNIVWVIP